MHICALIGRTRLPTGPQKKKAGGISQSRTYLKPYTFLRGKKNKEMSL